MVHLMGKRLKLLIAETSAFTTFIIGSKVSPEKEEKKVNIGKRPFPLSPQARWIA